MKKENKNITRKKLTKEFVEIYTFSLPHWRLAELGKKHLEKKLNKLSEKDFIEKLEKEHFGDDIYNVNQWSLFQEYIEQKKRKRGGYES